MGAKNSTASNVPGADVMEVKAEEDSNFEVEVSQPVKVTLDDFDLLKVVGKGSFGKVMQVRHKDTQRIYAMKVLRKAALVKRNQIQHTKSERHILQEVDSAFIVSLHFAFQTPDKLYLVLDYLNGGELFFHLKRERRFKEERVKLYAAEIVLAVESLHVLDIIYRDLKPENILLDSDGHICITDFGLSKEAVTSDKGARTFCGTPEYLAPEILKGVGHGKAVDWWSLGTLLYEMLTGLPPFYSQNLNVMYEKILKAELSFPKMLSEEAKGLLSGLLVRDPAQRLGGGVGDAEDIKKAAFFTSLDWDKAARKGYDPLFKPNVKEEEDTSQIDPVFTSEQPVDSLVEGNNPLTKNPVHFDGFTFTAESDLVETVAQEETEQPLGLAERN